MGRRRGSAIETQRRIFWLVFFSLTTSQATFRPDLKLAPADRNMPACGRAANSKLAMTIQKKVKFEKKLHAECCVRGKSRDVAHHALN